MPAAAQHIVTPEGLKPACTLIKPHQSPQLHVLKSSHTFYASRHQHPSQPLCGAHRNQSSIIVLQDKPLAVPPGQVDEAALAAARAEYVREKDRIKAKRLRELQESSTFRLH